MNLFKKTTGYWLRNSLFVLGVLSLVHQTQAQTSTPQKVETYRFTGKRANYSITATPHGAFSFEENTATNKVIDAWIGIGFKSDAPGSGWFGAVIDKLHRFEDWKEVIGGDKEDADQAASALHPFWSGVARFDVQTLDQDGEPYFASPLYTWSSTPEPYPSINPTPEDNAIRLPADKKSATKEFRVDLGDVTPENFNFPKTSEAEVTVVGGDFTGQPSPIQVKPPLPPAKVTIHWHWAWEGASGGGTDPTVFTTPASGLMTLENGTDQKPADQFQVGEKFYVSPNQFRRTITKIERNPDGTIKFTSYVDPDDNLDTENGDLQQQIEKIQAAYKETIYTGAQGVKYGLEAYKAVAEFYAYGPFFELGGEIVFRAGTKAAELLTASTEARQIAQRLRKLGESTEVLISRVKNKINLPNQTPEEVATLQKTLKELEDIAIRCERGSDDLERIATCGEKMAAETEEAVFANGMSQKSYCFAAGTPILMADGSLKSIELVKVGDEVMAKDVKLGLIAPKHVTRTFVHATDAVLNLTLGGERITTTAPHPFYVEGRGWVSAGELGLGTSIVTRAGPPVTLKNFNAFSSKTPTSVYNFTVEDFHTYFVGRNHLLVHNQDGPTCGISIEGVAPNRAAGFGTPGHKSWAWEQYSTKNANNPDVWEFERWSRSYDSLSLRAAEARAEAAEIGSNLLPAGRAEVTVIRDYLNGQENLSGIRRLDWAEETTNAEGKVVISKGIEVKSYKSGPVPLSAFIREQVEQDAKIIVNEGADIRWVFKYNGPNKPLARLLRERRIPWTIEGSTQWIGAGTLPPW